MASLPSVVLGFLAGPILAPFLARLMPGLFASLLCVPLAAFSLGALWHVMPVSVKYGLPPTARLSISLVLVGGVVLVCAASNGPIGRTFFGGDFPKWLQHQAGSGLPVLVVGLAILGGVVGFVVGPRLRFSRAISARSGRARAAVGLVSIVVPATLLALAAPLVQSAVFGGDFQAFLVGGPTRESRFDQHNSIVVGLAMGFAVIPVIFTIADDSLSNVPPHLTAGSLALGATRWQTAVRVVLPSASPGIFSAIMIGFGRAVGETMIVLMATGNTPIMSGSAFNGFRALSANVAVELPEAPQGGTLFRVLFVAALLLFAMTFIINTAAEIVRLRLRERYRTL
jgi:phosphate transport system permease protein